MSDAAAKARKTKLAVTPSLRRTAGSMSGLRLNTLSVAASHRRKSSDQMGDSRLPEKGSVPLAGQGLQVFDESGTDITPHPLYHSDPAIMQSKQSKRFSAQDTSSANLSDFLSTTFQTTGTSFAGPFTRSAFESSAISRSCQSTVESLNDEINDSSTKCDISVSLSELQVKKEDMKELMREDMLDDVVERYLTETETFWLLDMAEVTVSVDSQKAETVTERNSAYKELCKNRVGNDKYVDRLVQTLNGALKVKEVQSEVISMASAAVTATVWDMYHTYSSNGRVGETVESAETSTCPDPLRQSRATSRTPERTTSVLSTASTASTSSSHKENEAFVMPVEEKPDPKVLLQSEKFQQDLSVMERIVLQNIFQPKIAAYRHLPTLEALESQGVEMDTTPRVPELELLWSFGCEVTVGRNVSSMAWNKQIPDLLAVGYGRFDFKDQKSGLVCCWSLKNPMWPERIFHCQSSVTALDFSTSSPSLLAIGMHDGSIAIFNVRSKESTQVEDSSEWSHKHSGPVWQVKWVYQDRGPSEEDKGETLISVSADGRVSRWFLKKGLHCMDLMRLKRTSSETARKQAGQKQRSTDVLISRLAPGLCFDFHPKDSNIYLVGTEEGHIHKCSCSSREQYLETYTAHRGPVYQVTWSPFCANVFLSCSSDWTVRLWREDLVAPVLVFTSLQRAVFDVSWSHRWAAVFTAVNESRVEIWDLRASILDPAIVKSARPAVKLTSLSPTPQSDCTLLGDSDGHVGVYQLNGFSAGEGTQVDTLEEIIRSTLQPSCN